LTLPLCLKRKIWNPIESELIFHMQALQGLCIFLIGTSISVSAQQTPASSTTNTPSQAAARTSSSKNRQLTLDVVVANKTGKPQSGLQQQDFTLLDNKAPQEILSFNAVGNVSVAADPPVEVILLIDTLNTSVDVISDARVQIEKYLRRNDGKLAHPTSIVVLSNSGLKIEDPPSLDGNALSTSLKANKDIGVRMPPADPRTGESGHFVSSMAGLNSLVSGQAGVSGRKIVIWFSQGWPLLAGAEVRFDLKQKQDLFASVMAVSETLRRTRMTIYNIDPEGSTLGGPRRSSDKFSYLNYVKGVSSAVDAFPGNLSLQVLAIQSGGKVLINGTDVANQIQSCVDDTNDFYVLSFDAAASEPPGRYHSLEVKINKPGLTASTTTGYYSQP
jgi:VWFA-related protein